MNKTHLLSRSQIGVCALALAPVFTLVACLHGSRVSSYGPLIAEDLQVVPAASVEFARDGEIDDAFYSGASSDPFLDETYVLYGDSRFDLALVNRAEADLSVLGVSGDKYQIVNGANDIREGKIIVEVKDLTKLASINVNGKRLLPSDFAIGTPTLATGDAFDASARLPGAYAIVDIGVINALSDIPLQVNVDGDCDLTVHFDAFGKAYCEKTLVNAPHLGTTIVVRNSSCTPPSPTPSPSPSTSPSPEPSPSPSPSPEPSPSPSPSPEPSPSPSPEPSPSPSPSPSPEPSPSPSPSPSPEPSPSPSTSPSPNPPSLCPGVPAQQNCTRTIGEWKAETCLMPLRLPQWIGLPGGKHSYQVTSLPQAVEFLRQDVFGTDTNSITRLYSQFLAAKLSAAQGADTSSVEGVMLQADVFLANHDHTEWDSLSAIDRAHVHGWSWTLEQFNAGDFGPGRCSGTTPNPPSLRNGKANN
jgi:hypothetical protein